MSDIYKVLKQTYRYKQVFITVVWKLIHGQCHEILLIFFMNRTHDHDYADINGKFWKPLTDFERAKKGTWMCSLGWVNCQEFEITMCGTVVAKYKKKLPFLLFCENP